MGSYSMHGHFSMTKDQDSKNKSIKADFYLKTYLICFEDI